MTIYYKLVPQTKTLKIFVKVYSQFCHQCKKSARAELYDIEVTRVAEKFV